jgi:hypothetical protein
MKKRDIKEQSKKMRTSGEMDLSFTFTELGNDQTTFNMESFEEPADFSATYVSADHSKSFND